MHSGPQSRNSGRAEHVVRDMYGRVAEGASFIEAAAAAGDLFGCHMLGLHIENVVSRTSAVQIAGPATAHDVSRLMDEYERHWQGENAWLHRGMNLLHRHGISDGDEVASEAELRQIPYYVRFLLPLDIRHGVAFLLASGEGGADAVLSINRSRSAGRFKPEEKAQFPALLPHLQSAYRLSQKLQEGMRTSASLRTLLNAAGPGLALVSGNGTLHEINEPALNALAAVGCVQPLRKGAVLAFSRAAIQARFLKALSRTRSNIPGCAAFPAPSQQSPNLRYAMELLRIGDATGSASICLLITPLDVPKAGNEDEARLMQVFGFTASEALVVSQLVVLGSAEKVAQHLRLSLPTVRTHVQRAFQKACVSKQTELVVLAERVIRRTIANTLSRKRD